MKNYIDTLQSFSPTPEQETLIYARFLEKRQRVLFLSKLKYYTKLAVYSLGLVMIVGTALFSFPQQSRELYTRVTSNKAIDVYTTNPHVAHADTIGTILSLDGEASIARDGKEYPLDQIYNDATVVLKQGAILTFQVAGGLKTQLLGPARFQLHRETIDQDTQFTLDIQEGRMIQVESTTGTTGSLTGTSALTIKTPTLQLASIRSDKKVKLHIDTSEKQPLIANQGDAVTVKTTTPEKGVVVATIASDKVVVITDEGKLEEEITRLTKKIVIADHEISFVDLFSGAVENYTGTNLATTGTDNSGSIIATTPVSGDIVHATGVDSGVRIAVTVPIVKEYKETVVVHKDSDKIDKKDDNPATGLELGLGTTDLLTEEKLSAFKSQLYAPHLHQAIRSMMIAYTKADYQTFLLQKKEVIKDINHLYSIISYTPHIRVIASDPQVAVRQFQSLIEQLVLNINRSRGIPPQYINKLMSIEVMFMIMRNVGYGKFVNQEMSDDAIWERIADEFRKTQSQ